LDWLLVDCWSVLRASNRLRIEATLPIYVPLTTSSMVPSGIQSLHFLFYLAHLFQCTERPSGVSHQSR